jgi:ABC-type glycerol-3-phosphate transport system substrate-binding protein
MSTSSTLSCLVFGAAALAAAACAAGMSTDAHAQASLITCWYNEKNVYTGADTAQPGAKLGLARPDQSGDYTWAYTIRAADGTACPRTRPQS